jgi:hypothetical protein
VQYVRSRPIRRLNWPLPGRSAMGWRRNGAGDTKAARLEIKCRGKKRCGRRRRGPARAREPSTRRRRGDWSSRAEATPDGGSRPIRAGYYHSHSRSVRAIDQRVRTDFVLDVRDIGSRCKDLGISPGQMRHAEPSLSSTIWLLSCFLICIADLPCDRIQALDVSGAQRATPRATIWSKDGCADEFFREPWDRSAPPPESKSHGRAETPMAP